MDEIFGGDSLGEERFEEEILAKPQDTAEAGRKKAELSLKVFAGFVAASVIQLIYVLMMPAAVSAYKYFPAPHVIDESGFFVVLILGLTISFTLLLHGLYMAKGFSFPSFLVKGIGFCVGFIVFMIVGFCFTDVVIGVQDEMFSLQHSWAQERYGIVYDTISMESLGHNESDRQSTVYLNNEVVADVCPGPYTEVLFCAPGTTDELPVIAK